MRPSIFCFFLGLKESIDIDPQHISGEGITNLGSNSTRCIYTQLYIIYSQVIEYIMEYTEQ